MTSVLIVDGHTRMRRLVHSVVGTMADDIYECSDGKEALIIYGRLRPDYVLMDIEMKGLDGIQATRQILQLDPDARIIIVTQQDDQAYVLKDDLKSLRGLLQG